MMKNRLLFVTVVVAALSAAPLAAQTPTKIESTNGLVDASGGVSGFTSSGVFAQAKTSTSPDITLVLGVAGSGSKFTIFKPTTPYAPLFTVTGDGKVGIGTSAPAAALHVKHETAVPLFVLDAPSEGRFQIKVNDANRFLFNYQLLPNLPDGAVGQALIGPQGPSGGRFHLATESTPRMTIAQDGKVGIGTQLPEKLLHVAGDIQVDGNINAKFQDVAEWVPSKGDLAPGTVVVLSGERPNEVAASSVPYDTRVAGVVSPRPGLTLGDPLPDHEAIATMGRVRIRVDATRAPIRIGDLLVTGTKSGTAMRSEPIDLHGRQFHQPGTIIGKALEELRSGEGEILVLLSLQ